MKNLFFLFLFVCFFASAAPTAKDPRSYARPGEIATDRVFQFAYSILDRFYGICLNTPTCALSENESRWLAEINKNLPQEKLVLLQFESGKDNPARFGVDGQSRVAATGKDVGSPIYLNTDFFYRKDERSEWHPAISLDKAIIILTHELGHHLGVLDHQALDVLGIKVSQGTKSSYQWLDKPENINEYEARPLELSLGALQIEPSITTELLGPQTHLFFRDENFYTDLDPVMERELKCPKESVPLKGYKLMNFKWVNWKWGGDVSCRSMYKRSHVFTIRANAILNCEKIYTDYEVDIPFVVNLARCPNERPLEYVLLKVGPLQLRKEGLNFQRK